MSDLTRVAVQAMQSGSNASVPPGGASAVGAPGSAASGSSGASAGSAASTVGNDALAGAPARGSSTAPARTHGVVRADVFDPLPDADIPDPADGAGARAGSRGTRSAPDSAATQGTGTMAGADAGERAPEGERSIEGASVQRAPRPSARAAGDTPQALEIPAARETVLEGDVAPPEPIGAESPLKPLLGHWQQVDAATQGADFGPGGFDLSLLAIRPTQRSMQLYRAWGAGALVIAAELRATFDPAGRVRIEESPAQPSSFPKAVIEVPATDGRAACSVAPPASPLPCDTRWSLEQDGRLRLDGRLYRRIERSEFERLTKVAAAKASDPTAAADAAATRAPSNIPREPPGGVDFFGARVRGRYICFVCDISGSMEGDKLEALKAELTRTIRALPAGSHVQVTFFSDQTYVLAQGWTRTGTPACEGLLRKIDGVGCGGGTDAVGALTYALRDLDPLPHELFLLTDGHFARDPSRAITQLNGGADRTRIHTLGMGDDADRLALEAIAQAHGGTFTHVPAAAPRSPLP